MSARHTTVGNATELERGIKRLRRAVWDAKGSSDLGVLDDVTQMREMWDAGHRAEALAWVENEIDWWRN